MSQYSNVISWNLEGFGNLFHHSVMQLFQGAIRKISWNYLVFLTELFPPERIQIQERTHPNESIVDVSWRNIQNQIFLSTEIEFSSSVHTEMVGNNILLLILQLLLPPENVKIFLSVASSSLRWDFARLKFTAFMRVDCNCQKYLVELYLLPILYPCTHKNNHPMTQQVLDWAPNNFI